MTNIESNNPSTKEKDFTVNNQSSNCGTHTDGKLPQNCKDSIGFQNYIECSPKCLVNLTLSEINEEHNSQTLPNISPEKSYEYLIPNPNSAICTDTSRIEFGIRIKDKTNVVFKTVNSCELAKREYEILKKINQAETPHIIVPLDTFKNQNGNHIFVFPKLSCLETHNRDLVDIARIMFRILTALDGIHKLGIVHLDINPSNLMTIHDNSTNVRIIDFGLAHNMNPVEKLPKRGTFGYISPEIIGDLGGDGRVDVYSAGIVFGMMLVNYIQGVDLRYLGSPNVTTETINLIIEQLDDLLEYFEYETVDIFDAPSLEKNFAILESEYDTDSYSNGETINDEYVYSSFYSNDYGLSQIGYLTNDEYDIRTTPPYANTPHNNTYQRPFLNLKPSSKRQTFNRSPIHHETTVPLVVFHAADLLRQVLQENPENRPTAAEALRHPLFSCFDNSIETRKDTSIKLDAKINTEKVNKTEMSNTESPKQSNKEQVDIEAYIRKISNIFEKTSLEDSCLWAHEIENSFLSKLNVNNGGTNSPNVFTSNYWNSDI
ncbi:hypothetical protein BB559_001838 [Furculomyces boomerangus]|uniref:Protein kinase domain-containing protein n=2 Tax=Harpellales TaxID=61421 RepID=A0A2T9Z070_9FUNG|nr:hypothetical protein BB559_001838 [Furculomyces boomerangus]PWA03759.1 hypothetical protein BB558_000053 [Smittium angustum]